MFDFEKTRLWRESLGRTTTRHTHRKERERLRAALFQLCLDERRHNTRR
jgi:hypothetical protein